MKRKTGLIVHTETHRQAKSNVTKNGMPKLKVWCLTSTETTRLIRDGEKGVTGYGGGGEGDYIPIATLSPPE